MSAHICPPDHKHGDTGTCYVLHKCRCEGCTAGRAEYSRQLTRRHLYGTFVSEFVPVEPVREHFQHLQAFGMGWKRIAEVAGIGNTAACQIIYGRKGSHGDPRKGIPLKRIKRTTAEKILAVQPELENLRPGAVVPARGVQRRLQALIARGWSQSKIADRLQIPRCSMLRLMTGTACTVRLHRAVADLYEELWDVEPPHAEWRDKIAYSRVIRYAAQRRYLPPLAWDDIDNDAEPPLAEPEEFVDDFAVELACGGERIRLTTAERRAAVTLLHARRWSDSRIGSQLSLDARTILRIRQELELPAFDQNDLVDKAAA